jgi:hypothetical protein
MTTTRTIQVRPSRNRRWQKQGGWEVFEAEGVCPVLILERAVRAYYPSMRAGDIFLCK